RWKSGSAEARSSSHFKATSCSAQRRKEGDDDANRAGQPTSDKHSRGASASRAARDPVRLHVPLRSDRRTRPRPSRRRHRQRRGYLHGGFNWLLRRGPSGSPHLSAGPPPPPPPPPPIPL